MKQRVPKEQRHPTRTENPFGRRGAAVDHVPPPHSPKGWQSGFQNAFDQAAIGMALVGLDGRWLRVNPALCQIVGYSEREMLAANFQKITHPDDLAPDLAYVEQLIKGEIRSYQMEKRYLHKDGHFVWALLSVTLMHDEDNNPLFFFSQVQDITDRKHAEEALRDSDKRFHALLNNSPSLIFIKDIQGRYVIVNKQFEKVLRVRQEEIVGKTDAEVFAPQQADIFRAHDLEALQAGVPLEFEEVAEQEDGLHTSIVYKFPLLDAQGKIYAIGGIATDISERKRATEALQRSETRYRELVENTPYGVYHSGPDGRLFEVNPALVNMLGYSSKAELLALNIATDVYRDPEERARLIDLSSRLGHVKDAEVEWKRKDGKVITVRIKGRTLHDESGAFIGTQGIIENLTEWRELERQFRHSQKMEAVGRLAGGVAHDFNNLLMVISGYTELLARQQQSTKAHGRSVEQIQKAAERAASLTRQLLAFSRMQMMAPKVIDLNLVIRELNKMLPTLIGADIDLVFSPDPRLGQIKADVGQIEQVIVNLAVNARDAMPKGGTLTIETTNFVMDTEYARTHPPAPPGPYVMLAVTDTGAGIDAETLTHIFEPFYTTKEMGKGTGLGLATVYGIVKQSGGFIWVASEPGLGAKFEIYLPRVDDPPELPVTNSDAVAVLGGRETLLLVEDEEDLRDLVAEFLRDNGYTVLEAKDGLEGLEMGKRHTGPIGLLITDLVMPRMGGAELAEQLAIVRPGLRVVYLSGYSQPSHLPRDGQDARGTMLEKPVSMDLLARKIREILKTPDETPESLLNH